MKFETLLEKVKIALRNQVCLHCGQTLSGSLLHFCAKCQESLGVRQPKAVVDLPLFVCHAATHFNPTVKKLIYGYKFYEKKELEAQLAGLLVQYWEALFNRTELSKVHPENVLVIPIPPHRSKESQVEGFAKRFARYFGYEFRPSALYWQRPIEPQHTVLAKQARFSNILNSLQVEYSGIKGHERIIIIDDLTTTGATFYEANRALRQGFLPTEKTDILALAITKVPLGFSQ